MSNFLRLFFTLSFILNFARTIPHAVLTIVFIQDKNIEVWQIALIQIFFFLAIFLVEIPTGILADKGKRGFLVVSSFVTIIISYSIIYFATNITGLCIAWFFYGISTACSSGNLDGYIISKFKTINGSRHIKKFNVKLSNINIISSIIGAMFGSIMYLIIGIEIYKISVVIFIICLFGSLIIVKKIDKNIITKSNANKKVIMPIQKVIVFPMIILITSQLFYQPFFQYWQVLYSEKGVAYTLFGIIYAINLLIGVLSNKLYIVTKPKKNSFIGIIIIFLLLLIIVMQLNGIAFVLCFPVVLLIANLIIVHFNTILLEEVSMDKVSTTISINSTLSRLFGILVLILTSILLKNFSVNVSMFIMFSAYGIFLLIYFLILYSNKSFKKKI